MTKQLTYTLYRSRSKFQQPDLSDFDILRVAVRKNLKAGITGFLHKESGYFWQYVEGEAGSIERLMRSICADPRHSEVAVLASGPIPARRFGHWSMGFSSYSPDSLRTRAPTRGDGVDLLSMSPDSVIAYLQKASDMRQREEDALFSQAEAADRAPLNTSARKIVGQLADQFFESSSMPMGLATDPSMGK